MALAAVDWLFQDLRLLWCKIEWSYKFNFEQPEENSIFVFVVFLFISFGLFYFSGRRVDRYVSCHWWRYRSKWFLMRDCQMLQMEFVQSCFMYRTSLSACFIRTLSLSKKILNSKFKKKINIKKVIFPFVHKNFTNSLKNISSVQHVLIINIAFYCCHYWIAFCFVYQILLIISSE